MATQHSTKLNDVDEEPMKMVALRMRLSQIAELRAVAKAEERTLSQEIRWLVDRRLAEKEAA